MSFGEIIGQQKQIENLRTALRSGRLHHGYLFVGPDGVGKRSISLALAKAIHCAAHEDDFCGDCVNCTRIAAGNHPDVRFVGPLAGKKEISIQQIRDIEKELNLQSFTGQRKIAIFDPARLLNLSSQNALLKTLEEPPNNSLLILIASSVGSLLPTLRSRCLQVSFAPIEPKTLADFLIVAKHCSSEEANNLATLSMGSVGLALNLKDNKLFEKRREWAALTASIGRGDYRAASAAAEKLAANKNDSLGFLEWAQSFFRDVLVYSADAPAQNLTNIDLQEQIQHVCNAGTLERWLSVLEQTYDAGARIQRNLNRRMVLEDLLFNVAGRR